MKNLFILTVAACLLSLGACKKAEKVTEKAMDATEKAAEKVAEKAVEAKDAVVNAVDGVPNFEDDAVETYLNDYSAFIDKYSATMADKANVTEADLKMMRDKAQSFAMNAGDVIKKLKADEIDKFNTFFKSVQDKWAAANK